MSTPFQDGFREAVAAADEACVRRFGDRLQACYVAGSVAAGEAWPGASDLDWFVFVADQPTGADRSWRYRTQKRLDRQFPVLSEAHVNLFSIDKLAGEGFWRFILRYNAVRVRGEDVIAHLERRGVQTPRPSAELAKSRLPFVRRCLADAMAGKCPPALAELPTDPLLATRKLARNFVIVEGAFLLMSEGRFESFKQGVVLDGLTRTAPKWRSLFDTTRVVLQDPYRGAVGPSEFMCSVEPFMTWMIAEIEKQ